jgi:hypothetical protein
VLIFETVQIVAKVRKVGVHGSFSEVRMVKSFLFVLTVNFSIMSHLIHNYLSLCRSRHLNSKLEDARCLWLKEPT